MKLSIIYVHYNARKEIVDSIKSVFKYPPKATFEILVIDNSCDKKLEEELSKIGKVKYFASKKNIGFGQGCNLGAKRSNGNLLLFLNPDTKVLKNSLDKMLAYLDSSPRIGLIGPALLGSDKKRLLSTNSKLTYASLLVVYSFINNLFKRNPISKHFWMKKTDFSRSLNVDVVSGACMLVRASIFKKIKGFDKRFFMYFEEQDLCIRVAKAGFRVVYLPTAKIIHLGGRSLADKMKIRSYFEKSRYEYAKKYFGQGRAVFAEIFLRHATLDALLLTFFVLISTSVNTFGLDRLMLFIGDGARDFIAARNLVVTGQIPLVGIPSSVSWLHQGPLSVWFIALGLFLGNFYPPTVGYFFGFVGGITTGLIFYLGNKFFARGIGILAAMLYSFSPMVVVNARMPYHTSLVPFFTLLFFIVLLKTRKNILLLPLTTFLFGLLLMVELSNLVVAIILALVLFPLGKLISARTALYSAITFLFGILPFILFDLSNGPTYIKFPLWVINRLRYFVTGLPGEEKTSSVAGIGETFYQQAASTVLPQFPVVSLMLLVGSVIAVLYFLLKKRNKNLYTVLLWLLVPVFSFILHKTPGTAYFSLIYPAVLLVIAYTFKKIVGFKISFYLAVVFAFMNLMLLLQNDFFVGTLDRQNSMPPLSYSFGNSWEVSKKAVDAILIDAKGRPFKLIPQGIMKLYSTSLDPYIFLISSKSDSLSEDARLEYSISSDKFQPYGTAIYKSKYEVVSRHE